MLDFSKALRETVESRRKMKIKKVTCGLILTDGKQFLSIKPTGGSFRDIPKGMQEKGESYVDTVIREVKEETNIDISTSRAQLQPLGLFPYTPEKDVYAFVLRVPNLPDCKDLECTSTYFDGVKEKPEVGKFKYCTIKDANKFKKPMQLILFKVFEREK